MAELVLVVGQPVEPFANDLARARVFDARRATCNAGSQHRSRQTKQSIWTSYWRLTCILDTLQSSSVSGSRFRCFVGGGGRRRVDSACSARFAAAAAAAPGWPRASPAPCASAPDPLAEAAQAALDDFARCFQVVVCRRLRRTRPIGHRQLNLTCAHFDGHRWARSVSPRTRKRVAEVSGSASLRYTV